MKICICTKSAIPQLELSPVAEMQQMVAEYKNINTAQSLQS